jgi:hypothetical protein
MQPVLHKSPPDSEKSLTVKQVKAAALLANGNTIQHTADVLGVHENTIDKWKRKPEFMIAIRESEEVLFQETLTSLKKYAKEAVGVILEIMRNPKVAPYVRVNACNSILDKALDVHQRQELEARLQELEDVVRAVHGE